MKPNNLILIIASLLLLQFEIVYAQDDENQPKKLSFGAGIDIENLYSYEYFLPGANLILNIDLFNSIRVEPEIGFQTQKYYGANNQINENRNKLSYGSGFYGLVHFGNTSAYFGLKYVRSKLSVDRENVNGTYIYSYKESSVGPVVGLEYKFAKRISIGAEFDILHIKLEREENEPDDEYSMSKGWKTGNSIKFRFYF